MGIPPAHTFSASEVGSVRRKLLEWYDANHRQLPWRDLAASTSDPNQRAYAVWVSEIMLQQTQVATVIDYYNKWMKKWPTLQMLAKASLEEVHTVWAGLGYYSRGRRLLEGAQKVVSEMNGEMPRTAESLLKSLPGVGRYTAGAIASIAFKQPTGVVDGNVVRVWSRVRRIGADSTSPAVVDALWFLANQLVDPDHPGDFNQSVMELGATICTPKTPGCAECPIRMDCRAYAQVEFQKRLSTTKLTKTVANNDDNSIADIECVADNCKLCLPPSEEYDTSQGVMNYPRKPKKKPPREETTSVCLVCRQRDRGEQQEFLMLKRTERGLLAGLWEFPSLKCGDLKTEEPEVWLQTHYSLCLPTDTQLHHVGQIVHQFSHITQTYVIDCLVLAEALDVEATDKLEWKWMTRDDLLQCAISTAMKKIFKTYENTENKAPFVTKKRKRDQQTSKDGKKQVSLHSFFTTK